MKVYCDECRHFSSAYDHGDRDTCKIADPDSGSWKRRIEYNFDPANQNANNDCGLWQHRRGIIERFNDLIT